MTKVFGINALASENTIRSCGQAVKGTLGVLSGPAMTKVSAHVRHGSTIQYKVYDLYDRPWARIWEEYFEKDIRRASGR